MIGTICFFITLNCKPHYSGLSLLSDPYFLKLQGSNYAVKPLSIICTFSYWMNKIFNWLKSLIYERMEIIREQSLHVYIGVCTICHTLSQSSYTRFFTKSHSFVLFCCWPACVNMEKELTSTAGTNTAGQLLHTNSNKIFPASLLCTSHMDTHMQSPARHAQYSRLSSDICEST